MPYLLLAALTAMVEAPASGTASSDTMDLSDHSVVLSIDDGHHSVYTNIYPLLKRHKMPFTLALIVNSITQGQASHEPVDRFLNRSEIREMVDSCGIEIASHSLSHPRLGRTDSSTLWREIHDSRLALESLFGARVLTFVYPYGDVDQRALRMVSLAGYRLARAVRPGIPDFASDPFRIPETELRIEARLADIQDRIRRRRATVLLVHRVVPDPRVFTEWSSGEFVALVQWLDARRVNVTTLGGLYRTWWRRRLTRDLLDQLSAATELRQSRLFQEVDIDATRTLHPR